MVGVVESAPEPGVRVYVASVASASAARFLGLLDPEERERRGRYAHEPDRERFTIGRGMCRTVLAGLLERDPAALRFEAGPRDKPRLLHEDNPLDVRFNLSHSGDVVALAVTRGREVGIDVEWIRDRRDWPGLARRYFAPAEWRALQALPDELRLDGYHACWTRKEALVKATGMGTTTPFDAFEVEVDPRRPPRLLAATVPDLAPERWSMWPLELPAGYIGALALGAAGGG
jgi:4'-phosphopantetheinyl transferase